jgi:hypothetical protein
MDERKLCEVFLDCKSAGTRISELGVLIGRFGMACRELQPLSGDKSALRKRDKFLPTIFINCVDSIKEIRLLSWANTQILIEKLGEEV